MIPPKRRQVGSVETSLPIQYVLSELLQIILFPILKLVD